LGAASAFFAGTDFSVGAAFFATTAAFFDAADFVLTACDAADLLVATLVVMR
jgi:hypothetical protein